MICVECGYDTAEEIIILQVFCKSHNRLKKKKKCDIMIRSSLENLVKHRRKFVPFSNVPSLLQQMLLDMALAKYQ